MIFRWLELIQFAGKQLDNDQHHVLWQPRKLVIRPLQQHDRSDFPLSFSGELDVVGCHVSDAKHLPFVHRHWTILRMVEFV